MMPNVHLRIIEEIFQRTEWEIQIRVVEVADNNSEKMNNDKIANAEVYHSKRYVF